MLQHRDSTESKLGYCTYVVRVKLEFAPHEAFSMVSFTKLSNINAVPLPVV
jgi:hypothetical protein